ncbi:hypothetical protein BFW01_g5967 [Lasiodiplodia theobromae]|uniref:Uncharacterized protein n=2 Tax=Lasiodiplodia TaxID=66739 RepID=A0A5N5DA07_9PEZI|nr:uncharacterized protein LTHEOB_4662 [Lasiodiplodia theobromae]KAB2574653.1 hypothetical protein DBV05_g6692 [Lasiodiplodia theobromae]KAF4546010.1 hypothetical protein LTHEOB_4662 [Lasiodiplodia theobromae]KAF9635072.1 hypothetical protein BFW01_g5967 [Lasiodiplodia theobromae]KAK0640435.1 hypothetical protein DIS24_g9358 [Lasiodiplodia hormozganensis]
MDSLSIDSSSSWEQRDSTLPLAQGPLPPPPSSPTRQRRQKHSQALVRYQPPQVCGVLEVRKNACFLGVTAIVRRETRELVDSSEYGTYEYPRVKYVVEDLSWPVFKRFGGLDIIDPDLLHVLESKSRWWTKTDDWFLLAQYAFGKSRRRTLFTFADPSVPTLPRALPAPPYAGDQRDCRVSDRIEELA